MADGLEQNTRLMVARLMVAQSAFPGASRQTLGDSPSPSFKNLLKTRRLQERGAGARKHRVELKH